MPAAANDRGFAMTSSFTSMLLAAQLALDPDSPSGRYVDRLGAAANQLLAERSDQLAGLAARRYRRVVYLGSGALTGLAREAALKLLELTAGQVVSYWDSPLGFRHGPKAILEQEHSASYSSPPTLTPGATTRTSPTNSAAPSAPSTSSRSPHTTAKVDRRGTSAISATFRTRLSPFRTRSSPSNSHCSPPWSLGPTPDNPFPSGELSRVVRGVGIYPLPEPM